MESWAVVPESRPTAPPGHIFLITHTLPCVLHGVVGSPCLLLSSMWSPLGVECCAHVCVHVKSLSWV